MAQNEPPKPRTTLFNAAHFNITVDLNNPPPTASATLLAIRQKTKTAWEAFEVAEKALVRTDDEVHAEVLDYIWSVRPHRATGHEIRMANARATSRIYVSRIADTEAYYQELDMNVRELEEAALKEAETVEARATMEIDLEVMRTCLKTTREIINVAQIQLDQARQILQSS